MPRGDRRLLPISKLKFDELDRLHTLIEKMLLSICCTLLPSSPTELYRSFREQNVGDALLRGAIVDGVKAAKHSSIEGKTLRAVLCSCLSAKEVRRLLLGDRIIVQNENEEGISASVMGEEANREPPTPTISDEDLKNVTVVFQSTVTDSGSTVNQDKTAREVNLDGLAENRCHVNGCVIDVDLAPDLPGTATGHNCDKCRKPVHLYCCVRVLKLEVIDENSILLCSACLRRSNVPSNTEVEVPPICQDNLSTDTKGKGISAGKRSGSMARMFQASRKHWDSILCHGEIPKVSRTRTRCSDQSIREALRFIFLPENVQLLSWGTKRMRVGDKWVEFPAVLRKATTEKLFRDYTSHNSGGAGRDNQSENVLLLGRSSFIDIAEALTRGQQKRKAAVDYVLGTLVYENVRQAREIVSGEVSCEDESRILLKQLDAVEEFLKFTYLEHIDIDDDVLHSKNFALAEATVFSSNNPRATSCKVCLTPFQILRNIEMNLEEKREDIISALKEISHKTLLYMGHQHRCHNQEQRIASMFMDLNRDEGEKSVVILVDYKMKFEAIRFREKTTEFFGKKGMSWHGAVIFYKANDSAINQTEAADTMELSNLFFDHLISNDMTQDCVAVCSILDAILARLRIELPSVQRFWLLSDNARCYQNDLLPVMAPFITQKHSLCMEVSYTLRHKGEKVLLMLTLHFR